MIVRIIKRSKLSYQIYNFFQRKKLKQHKLLLKKYGLNKKYYSSISSKDFVGMEEEVNLLDKSNAREELPKIKEFSKLDKKIKNSMLSWSDKGYVILDQFYSEKEVDSINKEIENLIKKDKLKWRYDRIHFANKVSPLIQKIGTSKKITNILELLLGREVTLFQSLNFIKGSQQKTHSDSIHMTTFPKGNLIAIWIALEDITTENGALHYYPTSHKLPYIFNKEYDNEGTKFQLGKKTYKDYEEKIEEILKEKKLNKEVFYAKKGDVLIWHANLLHGGEFVVNNACTRKSMVFHYYAKDVICYHEITQRPTLR